ncbi:MAG: hypothetical protein L6243_06835 [Candidatus Altiarchaeales archaeon]|nr:hypothetical protein [Candidatus Altiarchaeota archaeon]MBU4341292.1 hypothetical protein [Candidatus Altiarchaeota archaeon]MBU4406747.1 hypothetical protein [Candidatus Altiarchaeota archaeon]MBU4437689.1 hypothetical protein [Candidatus Altiarchaeota archaeon]MCG2783287.1 hypothetical protein [Candidatus Altiarchaeales archaeon]
MKAVSNSTPLIYLAKLNKLPFLKKIFDELYVPSAVYDEVVLKGRELDKAEVIGVEKAIENGAIIVKDAKSKLKIDTLHKGELEAISLALDMKVKNILIDDKEGVEVCKVLGLRPYRTTAILLEFLKKDLIKAREFEDLLIELSKAGYFMRAEVFSLLLREAKRFKRK